jgi:hypothetical protein
MAAGPITRPRASLRQILALAFAPSAGLGPLRQLGGSLALIMPGTPTLLTAIALTSYLAPVFVALSLAGALLALTSTPGVDGQLIFVFGLLLAVTMYVVRTLALVRLFRVIMAQPLVAALLRSALAPTSPTDDQPAPAGPA